MKSKTGRVNSRPATSTRTATTTRTPAKRTTKTTRRPTTGRASKAAPLTDEEVVNLARQAVPERLHGREAVIRRGPEPTGRRMARRVGAARAPASADDTAAQIAKLVGTKLPPEEDEAVVEFEEETPLGKRNTAVHVRKGAVTRVVTRAKR
jgi:hypothetical protein